ncbi:hypothetical protein D3C78_1819710 [compost metagenome]
MLDDGAIVVDAPDFDGGGAALAMFAQHGASLRRECSTIAGPIKACQALVGHWREGGGVARIGNEREERAP